MTTRRARPDHVRRRPPSTGRLAPVARVEPPDRRRVRQYKGLDGRRRRAPLVTRGILAISVIALAAATFLAARGGMDPILSTLGAGISSVVDRLTATPVPVSTSALPTDSPLIAGPTQPYTSLATVDLQISLPAEVAGDPTAKVRLYLALEGLSPAPVLDVPVGSTNRLIVPFDLTTGRNDITATVFHDGVESEPSPVVTWILDQEPPTITIASPRDNSTVSERTVRIEGQTQGRSSIVARNEENGTSVSTSAAGDGSFQVILPLVPGQNRIVFAATDPAGNRGEQTLTLKQGSGEMRVRLSASLYLIDISNHPSQLQLSVLVSDPDGEPLPGATAFFTLQLPGLAPISNSAVTNANGRATFSTPLIGELAPGNGQATVLVSHELYGESTDRVSLRFVR
jgi:hypothetical protein